jgi:uncharacterized protein (TIGR03435 family)
MRAPEFKVVSIKLGDPESGGISVVVNPDAGTLIAKNAPFRALLALAYNLNNYQISGGPGWVNSQGYDIIAKPEGGFKERTPAAVTHSVDEGDQLLRLRLQALLVERFKLAFHRQTKELALYGLLVGKNGPKLRESGGSAARGNVRVSRGRMSGEAPISRLANELSSLLNRPVLDQTGLTGHYELNLEWMADDRMSILAAIQQQLGLKLEMQKGPVEILVIDHVEKAAATD